MKRRITSLTWLSALFCLLVVMHHILSDPITKLDPMSWQFLSVLVPQKLLTMAVSGYMIMGGLKLCLNPPDKFSSFYWKRFTRVLLPYFLALAIYYWYFYDKGLIHLTSKELMHYCFYGNMGGHLYYMVAYTQFLILTPLWLKIVKRWDAVVVLPIAVVISWLSRAHLKEFVQIILPQAEFVYNDRAFTTYLFHFLLGCYMGKDYDKAMEVLRRNRGLIIGTTAVLGILTAVGSAGLWSGRYPFPAFNTFHRSYQVGVILCLFLVGEKLPAAPKPVKLLNAVSYPVYLYHMLVIYIFSEITPFTDVGVNLIARTVFVYIVTIGACLIWHLAVGFIKNLKKEGIVHE